MSMSITAFIFLGIAFCSVWMPDINAFGRQFKPWMFYILSICIALLSGVITYIALPMLTIFVGAIYAFLYFKSNFFRLALLLVFVLLGLALSVHIVPGFNNPKLMDQVQLSINSAIFSQYLNFDKASAGLLFLAAFSNKLKDRHDFIKILNPSITFSLCTVIVVIGLAIFIGYVRFSPKFPDMAVAFLLSNLFFTCVVEQAFFQGFLQELLIKKWCDRSLFLSKWAPILIAALLFGVSHGLGSINQVALASILGFSCALIYQRTRLIESAISVHFALNLVHFLGFTYPYALS
jgi:uncharacterized protein